MQKQILIVEDNEINRAILHEILSAEYQVLEAENGLEGLNLLRRHKDTIALILLDVMMPVMDGYTFLNHVKADAELALIPIIVTTQNDNEEDEVAALVHGATDFVPKPYRPQVLLHRVASLIKLRETAAMVNQFRYDPLTGLYSKEYFLQCVRETLALHPEREYSLICANVENFKVFNDAFGIAAGDRLLKDIADAFRTLMGSSSIYGRYRADRFICLQERNANYHYRIDNGQDGRFSCIVPYDNIVMKWGIYEITDPNIPVELMCDRALLVLDHIKGQYNRSYAVYDSTLRDKLIREQAITDAMETALEEEQFVLYLQPKYSLTEKRIAGAEALVRWIHPQWGFMSPGEFIPLFERNGFIPKLDRYVWEQTCALLQHWRERGYPRLPVSVNVSRADILLPHLGETLLELTRKYGIDPADLHLEITETAYADNPNQISTTIAALRKLGFIIEMDDFGSGYSSLNMLSQTKLDVLKLDMRFVQNETQKNLEQGILGDVVSMAHRMHLSVVAEGVETQEQMDRLRAAGCDYVQGYYFAKPMPAAEFEKFCQRQCAAGKHPVPMHPRVDAPAHSLLVVDENQSYRARVVRLFEDQYRVLEAGDADQALACIRSAGESTVSAVILSATLPNRGADALLHALRQDPAYWSIPILSTIPNGDQAESLPLAAETDDFFCKCHPPFDLRRRVDRLLEAAAFRHREQILQLEACRDHLTGLLNRRGLEAAMAAIRKEEMPLAICIFDLDDLKKVNDTYGHDTGDRLLRAFADLLRSQTRSGDILCRYGGDEFIVILKHLQSGENAVKKGTEICRLCRDGLEKDQLPSSCSVGIALCGVDEEPAARLIERADRALYHAKREAKGGCCLWHSGLDTPADQ